MIISRNPSSSNFNEQFFSVTPVWYQINPISTQITPMKHLFFKVFSPLDHG